MKPDPFRLERYFDDHEFTAPFVCASDCESVSVDELLELRPGAMDELRAMRLGYTHMRGDPALCAGIAALYDGVTADDVLVCAAGEEVIYTFMSAALAPGDHVIVHTPCYQSLIELPRAIGCEVTPWPARPENGWAPDIDFLARHVTHRTRAIVVNAPHSPTGFLFDHAQWDELFAIADRQGAIVFSDEAYRGLEHRAGDRLPSACERSTSACSLGLLSKGFGLAGGLRIGWAVSRDRTLLRRMLEVKDYTTICARTVRDAGDDRGRARGRPAGAIAVDRSHESRTRDGVLRAARDHVRLGSPESGVGDVPDPARRRDPQAFCDERATPPACCCYPERCSTRRASRCDSDSDGGISTGDSSAWVSTWRSGAGLLLLCAREERPCTRTSLPVSPFERTSRRRQAAADRCAVLKLDGPEGRLRTKPIHSRGVHSSSSHSS